MDDFNWGNTRVVAGEKGKKIVISDEGKFDPASIPRKKWEEYQAELWDAQTTRDDARSEISGFSYATKHNAAVSEYGGWGSRPASLAGYPLGGGYTEKTPALPQNASRMSFAASEMLMQPNNRQSQFGGSQLHLSRQDVEMSNLAGLPSDDALLAEIREILRTADLMTVTKKGVKQELEKRFGVPLDSRRAYINSGMYHLQCSDGSEANMCENSHGGALVWTAVRNFLNCPSKSGLVIMFLERKKRKGAAGFICVFSVCVYWLLNSGLGSCWLGFPTITWRHHL